MTRSGPKNHHQTGPGETDPSTRLDKWLWAARFFKTRSLSAEAVAGGKVSLNGTRTQPGKRIRAGDTLRISRGQERFVVIVRGISDKRRGAPEAALLYEETAESREHRQLVRQQRVGGHQSPQQRPDKHARKKLTRIKRQS